MSTQDRPHADGGAGLNEFDRSVHTIGVGAGEHAKSPLGCGSGQRLRAGDSDSEGKVGVNVEVGEHLFSGV
jgi:hypothetical protein